jgi:hypothetical protein
MRMPEEVSVSGQFFKGAFNLAAQDIALLKVTFVFPDTALICHSCCGEYR